jgi:hypothetical protein
MRGLKHGDPPELVRQAEQFDDEQWYDFLDEVDEATRRRRQREDPPESLAGKSRDEVAAWLAKQHLFVDTGLREVWYLPHGAPADEIRFLDVSDRLAGPESQVEAMDFGLDVEGANFRLLVADVTSEVLEGIQREPSRLPPGWFLDGKTMWGRRK